VCYVYKLPANITHVLLDIRQVIHVNNNKKADQKYPGQNFYKETTNSVKATTMLNIRQHLLMSHTGVAHDMLTPS
jgi:hypothetical protein